MKKLLAAILAVSLCAVLLAGCDSGNGPEGTLPSVTPTLAPTVPPTGAPDQSDSTTPPENETDTGSTEPPATGQTEEPVTANPDMFTNRDTRTAYDESTAVQILLNGDTATASSNSVRINGSTVIIQEEATYVISGTLTDGMLVVNAPEDAKLQLVFNGAHITSSTSAALYILEADKVFLTLGAGTDNSLTNGGAFEPIDDNNIDGALFSKQDLTLNGSGSLTVTSPAGHGIVCKDDLVITGGSYTVHSASHGLDANDSVRLANATLSIDAGKDAIHAENSDDPSLGFVYMESGMISAEAEGDGISAGACLQITGGTVDLLTGGGSVNGTKASSGNFGGFMGGGRPGGWGPGSAQDSETDEDSTSMKGLKAAGDLLISGGTFCIDSADDSLHSDTSLTVSGGAFTIASGDDALHAEDTLTVTAGYIVISESYEGLEALHIDVQGGDITLTASDDGLNAAGGTDQSGAGGRDGMFGGGRPGGMFGGSGGSIIISGGTLYINASGDGIDANGTLEISGGHTTVVGPTQGDTATLDYDVSAIITGGTFIGTGASGMAQTFSDSRQGVIAVSVGTRSAGTQIILKDTAGNVLITHEPELNFAVVILSCPELVKGETYTIFVGEDSGDFEAY